MSASSHAKRRSRHGRGQGRSSGSASARADGVGDGGVYACVLVLLAVGYLGAWLLGGPAAGLWTLLLGAAVVTWFTHAAAWALYGGRRPSAWQRSLARLPLRAAGYGRGPHRPVEAAHDDPKARTVVIASAAISLVVLAALVLVVLRALD